MPAAARGVGLDGGDCDGPAERACLRVVMAPTAGGGHGLRRLGSLRSPNFSDDFGLGGVNVVLIQVLAGHGGLDRGLDL